MRRRALLLFACAASVGAAGACAAAAPEENAVALPPFIVEEAAKGPPWRYAEAMGYEILSRCDDRTTRRVIAAHRQLQRLLTSVLPPELQVSFSVPPTLILYDQELQPAASREVVARLLRDSPAPPDEEEPAPGGPRGFRLPPMQRRYSFLPNLRLWDQDGMSIFMIVRRDDFDPDRLEFTYNYVSFLLARRVPTLPPWFVTGFLRLYDKASYSGRFLTLPEVDWVETVAAAKPAEKEHPAPPPIVLEDFFAGRVAPAGAEPPADAAARWQAQAALFVRWGLDEAHGRREKFWRFVARAAVQRVSENLFQEHLGLDYAGAQTELAAYLPVARTRKLRVRPSGPREAPPVVLRNATDAEIGRIKGDWERLEVPFVHGISPELVGKYRDQARRTLQRAYDKGARDAGLLAVMGLLELDAGETTAARAHLEAAASAGPIRPRANLELARLRLAEFRAAPEGAEGRLSVRQTADVLRPLFAARAASPPLPEVYEAIAETWTLSAGAAARSHLAVVDEGLRLFPRRTSLAVRAVEANLRHGHREAAELILELARRGEETGEYRQQLLELERRL